MKTYSNNTTGSVGVFYDKAKGKWLALLSNKYLTNHETGKKYFEEKIDAIYARHYAQAEANYHTIHGR